MFTTLLICFIAIIAAMLAGALLVLTDEGNETLANGKTIVHQASPPPYLIVILCITISMTALYHLFYH